MISILISVFNHDPSLLAKDLSAQLESLARQGEIIIGNDSSNSIFMPAFKKAGEFPGVRIFHAEKNLGRSRMRNALAELAANSYLLFIDGDAMVKSKGFLAEYLRNASESGIVCGGTAYYENPPEDTKKILRWKYGQAREVRPAKVRNLNPHKSFSSFNFLIPAVLFQRIKFDENIIRYGHEDTIFGIEASKHGIPIFHIDNELIHNGLDDSDAFLDKSREALLNLVDLMESYNDSDILDEQIRLLNKYSKLRKSGFRHILRFIKRFGENAILRNLNGPNPSLPLFDLYKLCILNDIKA